MPTDQHLPSPAAAAAAPAAFVMPHFGDTPSSGKYLRAAVQSVLRQSDPDWQLILVDDGSPGADDQSALRDLARDPRIQLLCNRQRLGPGPSRNRGIAVAASAGAPFVLFLDSDDIASPDRLALTRAAFAAHPEAAVVYSRFEPIDSAGRPLDPASLSPSIRIILESLATAPPSGPSAWIQMATTHGYSNLTSTTAVRAGVASGVPFPAELVSDDLHTWLRYGGFGASYLCLPQITCGYRIPDPAAGSSCRRRYGTGFYCAKARVDSEALELAFGMAVIGGRLDPAGVPAIRLAFRQRLAAEIASEGERSLAERLLHLPPTQVASAAFFTSELRDRYPLNPDPSASMTTSLSFA